MLSNCASLALGEGRSHIQVAAESSKPLFSVWSNFDNPMSSAHLEQSNLALQLCS